MHTGHAYIFNKNLICGARHIALFLRTKCGQAEVAENGTYVAQQVHEALVASV